MNLYPTSVGELAIKEAMLEAYDVENKGEPPAYTIGYLVMRMWKGFRKLWK